jgi:hypothetical protein
MNIVSLIIERFSKYMLGGVAFESVKRIVTALESKTLSNQEKRSLAIDEMLKLGYGLTEEAIGVAVWLAVRYFKGKVAK